MDIQKSQDIQPGKRLVMIVYGKPGVGVTTFCATAPKPLILDFEHGTKYLGKRGFKEVGIVQLEEWVTKKDIAQLEVLLVQYDTIILDSLGEAMRKLITSKHFQNEAFRDKDGSLSIGGWQEAKSKMRGFITWLFQRNKTLIIAAHAEEYMTDSGSELRIQAESKIREEIPNAMDMICYLSVQREEDTVKRIMQIPSQGSRFDSKERIGGIPLEFEIGEKTGWDDFMRNVFGGEDEQKDGK